MYCPSWSSPKCWRRRRDQWEDRGDTEEGEGEREGEKGGVRGRRDDGGWKYKEERGEGGEMQS